MNFQKLSWVPKW